MIGRGHLKETPMRKYNHLDTLDDPPRRRSKAPLVVLFVLALIASPPLFEAARLGLSRRGLFGFTATVDTPVLDAIDAQWQARQSEFHDWVTPLMINRKWSPRVVLPIVFLWTAFGVWLLRKGHA
jgi:hypothetical protein